MIAVNVANKRYTDVGMNTVFYGRRALVVGGSGGIGAAVAKLLGEMGASVVVHGGTSRERLDASITAVRSTGAVASGFLLPIDSPKAANMLFRQESNIDIVVCAWGPFSRSSLARTTAEDWERAALLDLAFPGALASAYIENMAKEGYGRFLFFGGTTTDSVRGFTTTAAYSAAKTGIGVLVKSIALEYAGTGVSAVVVCPGFVDTEYLNDEVRLDLRKGAPGGRLLETEEVARVALRLIESETSNGAIVSLDAGLNLAKRSGKTIY
ncbi:MAG: SDR family oxidoreductase [Treponemataceae bacterium]